MHMNEKVRKEATNQQKRVVTRIGVDRLPWQYYCSDREQALLDWPTAIPKGGCMMRWLDAAELADEFRCACCAYWLARGVEVVVNTTKDGTGVRSDILPFEAMEICHKLYPLDHYLSPEDLER